MPRTRMMWASYSADLVRSALAGTPNHVNHGEGFFVQNGEGAMDLHAIAHLWT